jgi:hypothetical protein
MISISLFSTVYSENAGSIFYLSFLKKLDDIKNRKWVSCPHFSRKAHHTNEYLEQFGMALKNPTGAMPFSDLKILLSTI